MRTRNRKRSKVVVPRYRYYRITTLVLVPVGQWQSFYSIGVALTILFGICAATFRFLIALKFVIGNFEDILKRILFLCCCGRRFARWEQHEDESCLLDSVGVSQSPRFAYDESLPVPLPSVGFIPTTVTTITIH